MTDTEKREEDEHVSRRASDFPLVGLGASAGGIKALQTFFGEMPGDSGLAFVVVMHLSPDHTSSLAQVLQSRTTMPVIQVMEAVQVEPNHVYVIPPNKHILVQDHRLILVEPQQPAGLRVAIDLFFRTLATAYGQRAICIVLSGADGDGAIGIKHIKEQGGVTIAQNPTEAEYDSMPRSAIETGMVDWVLPVAQMPARLLEFLRNEQKMHVPPEETPDSASSETEAEDGNSGGPILVRQVSNAADETALSEVLRFLRGQTGHDFSHYKRATVLRRIARRLQVNLLEDITSYLNFLRTHSAEVSALLHDLLISVTNFFRDREAFAALESHIPQLFAGKEANDQVRVWITGCATGEEAYSIAILLYEHACKLEASPTIQVFATDIDAEVIQIARSGLYPVTIEADVSQERLQRFFQRDQGRYRIKKEVRELVLFSAHDILKDSPFSRMDLITCRNLLIYLKREAQERVFDIFHFALRPGALLFLGSSESIDDSHMLFAPVDKRYRLYVRRAVSRPGWQIPTLPFAPLPQRPLLAPITQQLPPPGIALAMPIPLAPVAPSLERRTLLFGDVHMALLERYAPPSIVINDNYDIVHLSEHAGQFLQFVGGEPSTNLLKVVLPALRIELRASLFNASRSEAEVTAARIPVELEGVPRLVNIHVRPVRRAETVEGFILVVFELVADAVEAPTEEVAASKPAAHHLEVEIQHIKEQLSATVEQYEASTEELKASNEELQAMNEELHSATEELETGKEELQSINEELTTVNHELKSNLEELSRVNNDLQNLMASTEIGTIFLDRRLRIKRFTPRVQELFNVIPTDVGRPLSDITHKLNYASLNEDAERVLRDLSMSEQEVSSEGRWFLGRMLPYRTLEDHIDGVVLTFVDITAQKQAAEKRVELEREVAVLAERNRMAQDLHDTLAQGLTGIKLQMDAAEDALPEHPDAASEHIVRAREITQQALLEARRSVYALRSQLVEEGGLVSALQSLTLQATSDIEVQFALEGTAYPLLPSLEDVMYRIGQEAVTNALQHAQARHIALELTYTAQEVRLRIHDDGKGFDQNERHIGLGITGMQKRASQIGADLHITSQPGQGTEVALGIHPPAP